MNPAQSAISADRRLVVLRILNDYQGTLNTAPLEEGLRAWGHRYVDRNMVLDDVRWLAHRELVTFEVLCPDVLEVTLTPTGERVATGKQRVEGVARPSPR
jgi:hypothetical protein